MASYDNRDYISPYAKISVGLISKESDLPELFLHPQHKDTIYSTKWEIVPAVNHTMERESHNAYSRKNIISMK